VKSEELDFMGFFTRRSVGSGEMCISEVRRDDISEQFGFRAIRALTRGKFLIFNVELKITGWCSNIKNYPQCPVLKQI
jgi:hypothetical protein